MFSKLLEIIKRCNNVAIITHDSADGDAFGSALMLHEFFSVNYPSINIDIFTDSEDIKENFKVMLGNIKINPQKKNYQLAISVDCADNDRFSKYNEIFANAKYTANIDHHQDNAQYADLNFVTTTSSNCENLYNLIKSSGLKLTKRLASFACVGVLTDTLGLATPNVTSKTYELIAEFLNLGVDVCSIRKMFFNGKDTAVLKLLTVALNNAEYLCDNKVMFISLNKREIEKCGANENNVSELIGNITVLSKCLAYFLVSPRKSYWHISMRCVPGLNINVLAKSMGGGGHICASATNTRMSINNIKTNIVNVMTEQIKNFTPPTNAKLFE